MRARLIFVLLIFSSLNLANAADCTETDKMDIENSIKNYLNNDKNSALRYKEVTLVSKNCVKGYAKVIVHPKKPVTDDAIVYLRQQNGTWQVLSLGTFFEPTFLANIPKELR